MTDRLAALPPEDTITSLHIYSCLPHKLSGALMACDPVADSSRLGKIAKITHSQIDSLDELRSALAANADPVQIVVLPVEWLLADGQAHSTAMEVISSLKVVSIAPELRVIVIGEGSRAQQLAIAMQAGADDGIVFPENADLMAARFNAHCLAAIGKYRAAVEHASMQESHKHILHEQHMAKQVFDKVAHEMVDLPNVRHWLSPLALFNGDVLLSTPTPSGGLLLLMGDFTGHGLGAALGAIPLASTFYGMASKGFALRDVVSEINRKLYETLPTGIFCCATMIQLDFSNGELEVWNAGLPDALILRSKHQQVEAIASSSLALGILSPQAFTLETRRMRLDEGDRLYLLTDGLSETQNAQGEQYGESRLRRTLLDTLKKSSNGSFESIKSDVLAFIDNTDRVDDISLVEINVVSEAAFSGYYEQNDSLEFHHPVSWSLDMEFRPETLKYQDPVPLILRNLIEEPSLRRFSGRLFTIVSELFNNALDHGLLSLDSQLKHGHSGFASYYEERMARLAQLEHGFIRCKLDYKADKQAGTLVVEMIDSGDGFDHCALNLQESCESGLHGRGLALVQSVCEELVFLDGGNHLRAVFSWP